MLGLRAIFLCYQGDDAPKVSKYTRNTSSDTVFYYYRYCHYDCCYDYYFISVADLLLCYHVLWLSVNFIYLAKLSAFYQGTSFIFLWFLVTFFVSLFLIDATLKPLTEAIIFFPINQSIEGC